ncbi:hypothetical protein SDJN03_05875, partial [Cucurbita argyrosperma subsp. sororia]
MKNGRVGQTAREKRLKQASTSDEFRSQGKGVMASSQPRVTLSKSEKALNSLEEVGLKDLSPKIVIGDILAMNLNEMVETAIFISTAKPSIEENANSLEPSSKEKLRDH